MKKGRIEEADGGEDSPPAEARVRSLLSSSYVYKALEAKKKQQKNSFRWDFNLQEPLPVDWKEQEPSPAAQLNTHNATKFSDVFHKRFSQSGGDDYGISSTT